MARTRQPNMTAAQWSPNGGSLGVVDLTQPSNYPFGEDVFSGAVQRQRLPKDAYKRLQQVLEQGEALDASLADSVALAMKEWALEKGDIVVYESTVYPGATEEDCVPILERV